MHPWNILCLFFFNVISGIIRPVIGHHHGYHSYTTSGNYCWLCAFIIYILAIPLAARSKTWVCGCCPASIAGLNPAGGMGVSLLWVLCGESECGREASITRKPRPIRGWCAMNYIYIYLIIRYSVNYYDLRVTQSVQLVEKHDVKNIFYKNFVTLKVCNSSGVLRIPWSARFLGWVMLVFFNYNSSS